MGQYVQYLRLSTRLKSALGGTETLLDKAEAAKQRPFTIYKDYTASLHRLRKDFKEN